MEMIMTETANTLGQAASGRGAFVWYDIMTGDMTAAEAFYTKVMGWTAKDSGMSGPSYTILSAGNVMVAGAMPIPPDAAAQGARPCWTGYIGVDDVDAYAQRVVVAGGCIHKQPDDIPGVGRFAVAADLHGAQFILFTPNGASGTATNPVELGHIGWHELMAGELEPAFQFYSGLFGWTKDTAFDMGAMGLYQMFSTGTGGSAVGGIMKKPAEMKGPAAWLYYVNVDGIAAAAERVRLANGQVINGPHQIPGGSWIVQCLDPQRAMFAMVSMKP
jgi:uncharacterized protein